MSLPNFVIDVNYYYHTSCPKATSSTCNNNPSKYNYTLLHIDFNIDGSN